MKNDFRLMNPIWNMGFIIILAVIAFIESGKTNNTDSGVMAAGVLIAFIILAMAYWIKLKKHNREHPDQRISTYTLRPAEYLEEDEGMTYITRKAAQKVYSYFSVALPVLAVIAITTDLPRLFIILGILLIALGQYGIYYADVRKHFKEAEE